MSITADTLASRFSVEKDAADYLLTSLMAILVCGWFINTPISIMKNR